MSKKIKKPNPEVEEVVEIVDIVEEKPVPPRKAKPRSRSRARPKPVASSVKSVEKPKIPPHQHRKPRASHVTAGFLMLMLIGLSVAFVGYTWAPLYRQWTTDCSLANGIPVHAYGQPACLRRDALVQFNHSGKN